MRTATWLMFGLALLGSTVEASAQQKSATVKPGYLGIRFEEQNVVSPQARRYTIIVREVSKNSPAEKAGVRANDEIIRINGLSVDNGKFSALARTLTEGDTVTLRIKRGDQQQEFTVIAAARPAGYYAMSGDRTIVFSADSVRGLMKLWLDSARLHIDSMKLPRVFVHPGDSTFDIRIERFGGMPGDTLMFRRDSAFVRRFRERLPLPADSVWRQYEGELGPAVIFKSVELGGRSIAGAEFTNLDPAMKTYFGTDRGLLTLRVAPETPAARAGLVAGDIVLKADGRDVQSVVELRRALFNESGSLKIEVLRKGEKKTLEIQTRRKGSDD